jgi:transposase
MGDPHVCNSGRSYAASLGITPRQQSSGGSDSVKVLTLRRANVIRTRVDGRKKGRILFLQFDPESKSNGAACNAEGVQ